MSDATLSDQLKKLEDLQIKEYEAAMLNCADALDDNSGIDVNEALDSLVAVQNRIDALKNARSASEPKSIGIMVKKKDRKDLP